MMYDKENQKSSSGLSHWTIGIAAIIVIVVIVVFFAGKKLFFTDNGYEDIVKTMMEAIEKQDMNLLLSIYPEEAIDKTAELMGTERSEVGNYIAESFGYMLEDYEYNGDIKVKYTIKEVQKLDNETVRSIENSYENGIKVKKGKLVRIAADIYVDSDKKDSETLSFRVFKSGEKWYMDISGYISQLSQEGEDNNFIVNLLKNIQNPEEMMSLRFQDTGNDPNNIYQSMYCLAFDENHIYYSMNDELMQANLDGSDVKKLGEGYGFLNVYDGFIYYARNYGTYKSQAEIGRINLNTLEKEVIMERSLTNKYDRLSFSSVLIADGYLFYGLEQENISSENVTEGGIIDLSDNQIYSYVIKETGKSGIKYTVSKDMVYAFVKDSGDSASNDRIVYELDLNDIRNGKPEFRQITEAEYYVSYNTLIFFPKGIYRLINSDKSLEYYKFLFEDIDGEKKEWPISSKIDSNLKDMTEEKMYRIGYKNPHFVIGNNMIVLSYTDSAYDDQKTFNKDYQDIEIYYYKNMDFENEKMLGNVMVNAVIFDDENALYGIHDDTLYIIETLDDGGHNLVTISKDGNITRVPMQ